MAIHGNSCYINNTKRSMFNVLCKQSVALQSTFNVQCSTFNVQCSTFNVQRSFPTVCSVLILYLLRADSVSALSKDTPICTVTGQYNLEQNIQNFFRNTQTHETTKTR